MLLSHVRHQSLVKGLLRLDPLPLVFHILGRLDLEGDHLVDRGREVIHFHQVIIWRSGSCEVGFDGLAVD